jgi:predicted nicotinamide N-methyase
LQYLFSFVSLTTTKKLGAGLGLNGILAHRLAPTSSRVVVTDGDTDALTQLRSNIEINRSDKKGTSSNVSILAAQLLWGTESAKTFARAIGFSSFDVIIASDILYATIVINPLWETIRQLLSYPDGLFWMAFARRKVPVTIDCVLQKAQEYGFRYKLVSENNCIENKSSYDDGDENYKYANPEIEDAAGAEEVYIYEFKWKTPDSLLSSIDESFASNDLQARDAPATIFATTTTKPEESTRTSD